MKTRSLMIFSVIYPVTLFLFSGCSMLSASNQGPQLVPASTTLNADGTMTFQVVGGTSPYQFQVVSGEGSVDGSGDFQAGNDIGQTQLEVTDANGRYSYASISVINSTASPTPTINSASVTQQAPVILGETLGAQERQLASQGAEIQSQFVKTNLKHPIVRVDQIVVNGEVVRTREVIEDQFVVTLQDGVTESSLKEVLQANHAHISKRLSPAGTYLVSLNTRNQPGGVTQEFLASRDALKKTLKTIAEVSPNYLSRAPASN